METGVSFDKASYGNRGGCVQILVSACKVARHFSAAGIGNVVKYNAEHWLTENAIPEFGVNFKIRSFEFFQLANLHPKVLNCEG